MSMQMQTTAENICAWCWACYFVLSIEAVDQLWWRQSPEMLSAHHAVQHHLALVLGKLLCHLCMAFHLADLTCEEASVHVQKWLRYLSGRSL